MKILYVSSWHSVLERSDLDIFNALQINWFSTGCFLNPDSPRYYPGYQFEKNPIELTSEQRNFINEKTRLYNDNKQGYSSPVRFSKNFADQFDIILINNRPYNLEHILKLDTTARIIYRTYDYHHPKMEEQLGNLKDSGRLEILRLFDWEEEISWTDKGNPVIVTHVDEDLYKDWKGNSDIVLTFCNNFDGKTGHVDPLCRIRPYMQANLTYKQIVENFNYLLHGHSNRSGHGPVSFQQQLKLYKDARVYFNLSCPPAWHNYSLMEAMMTGCPTVSFDEGLGGFNHPDYEGTFKLKNVIPNSHYGLVSDNVDEIKDYIKKLIDDYDFAKKVSANSKKQALKYFSKERAIKDWKNFLSSVS